METRDVRIPWPNWRIVRRLESGSYGVVYEIERNVFDKTERAALKVISIPKDPGDLDSDYAEGYDEKSITEKYSWYLEKIAKEYQLMAGMKGHSNIVNCDDFAYVPHEDCFGWDVFIRMELLTPLNTRLRAGEFTPAQTVKLGTDICRALEYCEKKHIVHRDIKPQNIMISEFGDYKLGDFGVARVMDHATNATYAGTDHYMAPEVHKNEKYGQEADIYSLGIVLYWLLNNRHMPFLPTGCIPNESERSAAYTRRMSGEPVPDPENGSAALKKIVRKACAYQPADRYASAAEMLRALEATPEAGGETGSGYSGLQEDYGFRSAAENRDSTPVNGRDGDLYVTWRVAASSSEQKTAEEDSKGNSWADNQETIGVVNGKKKPVREESEEKTIPEPTRPKKIVQPNPNVQGEKVVAGEKAEKKLGKATTYLGAPYFFVAWMGLLFILGYDGSECELDPGFSIITMFAGVFLCLSELGGESKETKDWILLDLIGFLISIFEADRSYEGLSIADYYLYQGVGPFHNIAISSGWVFLWVLVLVVLPICVLIWEIEKLTPPVPKIK